MQILIKDKRRETDGESKRLRKKERQTGRERGGERMRVRKKERQTDREKEHERENDIFI